MGLKRTQGQKRNCKKGTRKQQNKRTGKRKTAKKNLRRKRQTKRRLKGGASVLGIRKEGDTKKRKAENEPNLENTPDYSPAVKRGKQDKNNYHLNPENDKNNYFNPDYTRGVIQSNFHEVENEVYYLDEVNSGAYNPEELNKLKELYENRMTRKNWKKEFEDYIDERREEKEEEEKGSAGEM